MAARYSLALLPMRNSVVSPRLMGNANDAFRTINEAPADRFREAVGARLDFDSTLRLLAAEAVLAEWDGVLGTRG